MTAPITGPVAQTDFTNIDGAGSYRCVKHRYKQSRPYDKPAPYLMSLGKTVSAFSTSGSPFGGMANANTQKSPKGFYACSMEFDDIPDLIRYRTNQALADAKERVVNQLGDPAALLTLLAERQKALEQIADIALWVRDFVKVRRGILRPGQTGIRGSIQRHIPSKQKVASDYLAVQFGILPTLDDLENSQKLLENPLPMILAKGRRTHPFDDKLAYEGYYYRIEASHKGAVSALVQAGLWVDNPNLFLANRLGLINPVLSAYELAPWSFVFDYFVNVSQWLGAFTEFAGVNVIDPFYTLSVRDSCVRSYRTRAYPWLGFDHLESQITSESVNVRRQLGLPDTKLLVRAPWRLSTNRASTSVALLLQMLKS